MNSFDTQIHSDENKDVEYYDEWRQMQSKRPKRMRFTVMRIHSDYIPRYALTLIGWTGEHYIVPRYLHTSIDRPLLAHKAEELNRKIHKAGKLLRDATRDRTDT